MTIENYNLVEHYDYIVKSIPQPFTITSNSLIDKDSDDCFYIKMPSTKYALNNSALKKLVDALGVKVKLLSSVCSENDVFDLVLPIVNKLFNCFSGCFVFYTALDDASTIIDLNVNSVKGEEDTKYADGPSPWSISVVDCPTAFTCFNNFMTCYNINSDDNILVKAEELMPKANTVLLKLFKMHEVNRLQPMLYFSSKFSNIDGFNNIYPVLYDADNDVAITFPMNYAKSDDLSFDNLWKKVIHLYESTDLNDYISREITELAASNDTPEKVKSFISDLLVDNTLNINQTIGDIIVECNNIASTMKPNKAKKLKVQLGNLIGWCLCAKHSACDHCGRISIVD